MYCQKCRAPLKLDSSVEELNPAAFDLLVGSSGKTLPEHSTSHASSRPPYYALERRDLYDRVSRNATPSVHKRSIPAPRADYGGASAQSRHGAKDNAGMSFIMLTESQVVPPPAGPVVNGDGHTPSRTKSQPLLDGPKRDSREHSISSQIERTHRLFEIISARSDIDHPTCAECTELLVDGLEKCLANATRERDYYISFLKSLNASIPASEEVEAAEESLKTALDTEAAAFEELKALEKEKDGIDDEIAALEEESRQLDLEEEQFWRDRNAFTLTLSEFQNERDALNMKYDHDSRQLERLQRTNVYNDTFCIGHDGFFGTINGLRLGRLANPSVEWSEINAAWGQTLLLLATIAGKLGFQFQGYRLKPMGSASKIEKVEYPTQQPSIQSSVAIHNPTNTNPNTALATTNQPPKITPLDLFSSENLPLNLARIHRRFDNGMVAFLECLRQIGTYVENTPPPQGPSSPHRSPSRVGLKLPYEIKRDKIGDASIKLGFNQSDETWTRACKYTLTCCKFLLAHASNVASSSGSSNASITGVASAGAGGERGAAIEQGPPGQGRR
ncbi:autophagy protein 6 [Arachnomyces sp. PD_36]|nr:autophagy protein 6 [Arachnomyces sp. PD_36]